MSEELITTENVSLDAVKIVLEQAFMDPVVESDRTIMLKDQYKIWLNFDPNKRYIQIRSAFRVKDGASHEDLLEYVNGVNTSLIFIRLYVHESSLVMDHYIWLDGGVTKKNLVKTVKFFFLVIQDALAKAGDGLL
ncbi:MAG: YbjN domain-containing protein [Planctomycetes bacterium]|nr:YbjN domain-containing protein [Planctomycetota bacterium]